MPVEVDLTDVIDPVLKQRPDNGILKINTGPDIDVMDIVENSETFLFAWEIWENYANLLENTLISVKDELKTSR